MNEAQRTATRKALSKATDDMLQQHINKLSEFIDLNEKRIMTVRKNRGTDEERKIARIQRLRRWIEMRYDRLEVALDEWESRHPADHEGRDCPHFDMG